MSLSVVVEVVAVMADEWSVLMIFSSSRPSVIEPNLVETTGGN